jgi:hypothetical protein
MSFEIMDDADKLLEMKEEIYDNKFVVSVFHCFRLTVSSYFPLTGFYIHLLIICSLHWLSYFCTKDQFQR